MIYRLYETKEAVEDVLNAAIYIKTQLNNSKAANDFLDRYNMEAKKLTYFPLSFRCVNVQYRNYEIRRKSFGDWILFFVVNMEKREVIILRVLNRRRNWNNILHEQKDYHW